MRKRSWHVSSSDAGHLVLPLTIEYSLVDKANLFRSLWPFFNKTMDFDGDKEQVAKDVEGVATDMIQVHVKDNQKPFRKADIKFIDGSFSHLVHDNEDDRSACSTAPLESTALTRPTIPALPMKRFEDKFKHILVDACLASENSSVGTQNRAYRKLVGHKKMIRDSRAAVSHFGIGSWQFFWVVHPTFFFEEGMVFLRYTRSSSR